MKTPSIYDYDAIRERVADTAIDWLGWADVMLPIPASDPHVYGRMWHDNGRLMPSLTDADGNPWGAWGD